MNGSLEIHTLSSLLCVLVVILAVVLMIVRKLGLEPGLLITALGVAVLMASR